MREPWLFSRSKPNSESVTMRAFCAEVVLVIGCLTITTPCGAAGEQQLPEYYGVYVRDGQTVRALDGFIVLKGTEELLVFDKRVNQPGSLESSIRLQRLSFERARVTYPRRRRGFFGTTQLLPDVFAENPANFQVELITKFRPVGEPLDVRFKPVAANSDMVAATTNRLSEGYYIWYVFGTGHPFVVAEEGNLEELPDNRTSADDCRDVHVAQRGDGTAETSELEACAVLDSLFEQWRIEAAEALLEGRLSDSMKLAEQILVLLPQDEEMSRVLAEAEEALPGARANFIAALKSGEWLLGEASSDTSTEPFRIRFTDYNEDSGDFKGVTEWYSPSDGSQIAIEGKLGSARFAFYENRVLKQGLSVDGYHYDLGLAPGRRLVGLFYWWDDPSRSYGRVWIDLNER